MAYTNCSRCNQTFHLRLVSEEALNELKIKEEKGEVLCFGCFKKLEEYDIVEVIKRNESVPEADIGDTGTILMNFENEAFEVECGLPDGTNKWLGAFKREQIKWVQQ